MKLHLLSLYILSIKMFLIFSCSNNKTQEKNISDISNIEIENSIHNAINFLYHSQLEYGEFRTLASSDIEMEDYYFDSSPFVTSTILYSIKDIYTDKTIIIKEKAIDFLLSEQEPGGVWRYWTSRNHLRIRPDLDDISLISYILKTNDVEFENNIELILNNLDENGLFMTWINDNDSINSNDVDCVVNANALLHLGYSYPKICRYLNTVVEKGEDCSKYYPDRYFLYYSMSRAIENDVECLTKSKDKIISSILNNYKQGDSYGSNLRTALAINTLLILGIQGDEVNSGIHSLINNQKKNGSWRREPAWLGPAPYYGSEELSTGLALEALYRYYNLSKE